MGELTNVDDEDPATAAAYRKAIRERFKTMEHDRAKLQQEVDTHRAAHHTPGTNAELLDILPELTTGLGSLTTEDQRELYDAFQLQIHYNRPRSEALIKITINSATADDLARLTQPTTQPTATRHAPPCQDRERRTKPGTGIPENHETHATRASHVLRAPGRSQKTWLVVTMALTSAFSGGRLWRGGRGWCRFRRAGDPCPSRPLGFESAAGHDADGNGQVSDLAADGRGAARYLVGVERGAVMLALGQVLLEPVGGEGVLQVAGSAASRSPGPRGASVATSHSRRPMLYAQSWPRSSAPHPVPFSV